MSQISKYFRFALSRDVYEEVPSKMLMSDELQAVSMSNFSLLTDKLINLLWYVFFAL